MADSSEGKKSGKKPGRPFGTKKDSSRSETLKLRLTAFEIEEAKAAAEREGTNVSDIIRKALRLWISVKGEIRHEE